MPDSLSIETPSLWTIHFYREFQLRIVTPIVSEDLQSKCDSFGKSRKLPPISLLLTDTFTYPISVKIHPDIRSHLLCWNASCSQFCPTFGAPSWSTQSALKQIENCANNHHILTSHVCNSFFAACRIFSVVISPSSVIALLIGLIGIKSIPEIIRILNDCCAIVYRCIMMTWACSEQRLASIRLALRIDRRVRENFVEIEIVYSTESTWKQHAIGSL